MPSCSVLGKFNSLQNENLRTKDHKTVSSSVSRIEENIAKIFVMDCVLCSGNECGFCDFVCLFFGGF